MLNGGTSGPGLVQTGLSQIGLQSPYISGSITIPVSPSEWKKLSRDTQLRVLDELGILNL